MMAEPFEASLRNYDPALSLRWSGKTSYWVVERKERVSDVKIAFYKDLAEQPNARPDHVEIYLSALRGCNFVLMTPILGRHVFDKLYAEDMWTHGTEYVDRHMRRLDEQKAKRGQDDSKTRQVVDALHFVNKKGWDAGSTEEKGKVDEVFKSALEKTAVQPKAEQLTYKQAMKSKQKKEDPTLNKLGEAPKWMLRDAKVV